MGELWLVRGIVAGLYSCDGNDSSSASIQMREGYNPILDDARLRNIDRHITERVIEEIICLETKITWDDI